MTPFEPNALVVEVLRQWNASLPLVALVGLISAVGGAYFSGYLRKRGQDRAIREGFAEIRDQLKVTTRDTEEIKQHLSGRAWRSQQEWSARERYYNQLLTHLHHFRLAIGELSEYFAEPGTEYMPDEQRGERFRNLQTEAANAYSEVERLLGPSALFLSDVVVQALNHLFKEHWGLANFDAACTADYVLGARRLAEQAYAQVLAEAKAELGIGNA